MKQLALDLSQEPAPTFDNFAVGRNAEAVTALRQPYAYRGQTIYLWGAEGSGKSHLLHAVLGEHRHALRIPIADFHGASVLETPDLLILDDVHGLPVSAELDWLDIYHRVIENQGVMIAAGDAPPARLALRPDIKTRLGHGLVFEIQALSDDERAQVLRRHAAQRGFDLNTDAIDYLLRHVPRKMNYLLRLLDEIDRHSLAVQRVVSVPLIRDLLREPNTESEHNVRLQASD